MAITSLVGNQTFACLFTTSLWRLSFIININTVIIIIRIFLIAFSRKSNTFIHKLTINMCNIQPHWLLDPYSQLGLRFNLDLDSKIFHKKTALKLLWNCSEKMIRNCSETALKLFWNCSKTALKNCSEKLLWNCSKTALKLLLNCFKTALKLLWKNDQKLLWNCSKTALKLL